MNQRLTTLLLNLALLASVVTAFATTPTTLPIQPINNNLYQVEVIVFQHITPDTLNSEQWPNNPKQPNLKNAIQLTPYNPLQPTNTYELLPSNKFILNREQQALANKDDYQIILHQAWIQPITENSKATSIQITSSNNSSEISGTLSFSKRRFIQTHADLLLTVPTSSLPTTGISLFPSSNGSFKSFRLLQTRRMKIKELNYFDNPVFGVLVKVVPVSSDKAPDESVMLSH